MARERPRRGRRPEQTAFADIGEFAQLSSEVDRERRRLEQAIAIESTLGVSQENEVDERQEPIAIGGQRVAAVWMSETDSETLSILKRLSGQPESETLEDIVRTGLEIHLHEQRRRLSSVDLERLERRHDTVARDDAGESDSPRDATMEIGIWREELEYIEALATIAGHSPRETVEALVSRGLSDLTERLEWTISRVYEPPATRSGASRRESIKSINETVRRASRPSADKSEENG